MSRIQIPASQVKKDSMNVFVGWDNPLETFFGQVYDLTKDEDEQIIHWVGLQVGEIKTVSELDKKMYDFCVIPITIASQLMDDRNNRTEPTALQKWGGRDLVDSH